MNRAGILWSWVRYWVIYAVCVQCISCNLCKYLREKCKWERSCFQKSECRYTRWIGITCRLSENRSSGALIYNRFGWFRCLVGITIQYHRATPTYLGGTRGKSQPHKLRATESLWTLYVDLSRSPESWGVEEDLYRRSLFLPSDSFYPSTTPFTMNSTGVHVGIEPKDVLSSSVYTVSQRSLRRFYVTYSFYLYCSTRQRVSSGRIYYRPTKEALYLRWEVKYCKIESPLSFLKLSGWYRAPTMSNDKDRSGMQCKIPRILQLQLSWVSKEEEKGSRWRTRDGNVRIRWVTEKG